jgi:dihydrodipicolinate synthase/N-acetylneuraminate lyase
MTPPHDGCPEHLGAVSQFASTDLCLYDNPFVTKTWLTAAQIGARGQAVG